MVRGELVCEDSIAKQQMLPLYTATQKYFPGGISFTVIPVSGEKDVTPKTPVGKSESKSEHMEFCRPGEINWSSSAAYITSSSGGSDSLAGQAQVGRYWNNPTQSDPLAIKSETYPITLRDPLLILSLVSRLWRTCFLAKNETDFV